jgi:xanthine/uracil permease
MSAACVVPLLTLSLPPLLLRLLLSWAFVAAAVGTLMQLSSVTC